MIKQPGKYDRILSRIDEVKTIDKFALDDELVKQPGLVVELCEALGEAESDVDDAKRALDVAREELKSTEARLDTQVRSDPGAYGVEKSTEAAIKACVQMSTKRKRAQDIVNEKAEALSALNRTAKILSAAVKGATSKDKSLTSLVYLHGAGYFASSKPRHERINENQKRAVRRAITPDEEDGE